MFEGQSGLASGLSPNDQVTFIEGAASFPGWSLLGNSGLSRPLPFESGLPRTSFSIGFSVAICTVTAQSLHAFSCSPKTRMLFWRAFHRRPPRRGAHPSPRFSKSLRSLASSVVSASFGALATSRSAPFPSLRRSCPPHRKHQRLLRWHAARFRSRRAWLVDRYTSDTTPSAQRLCPERADATTSDNRKRDQKARASLVRRRRRAWRLRA